MDELLIADNTNISFELKYNSRHEKKNRFIRSNIDFYSNSETAKKILSYILEDMCVIFNIPLKVASQMNMIIEEVESGIRSLY